MIKRFFNIFDWLWSKFIYTFIHSIFDLKEEDKNIRDFKLRETYRSEIIDFIKKNNLKELNIEQMVGTNIKYIGWFLRDSFYKKVSNNGINLIIKWYLRFLKNPKIYEQIFNEIKWRNQLISCQISSLAILKLFSSSQNFSSRNLNWTYS